jgi:hypothetical protein
LAGGVIDESSVDDTGAVPEGGTEENAVDVALP